MTKCQRLFYLYEQQILNTTSSSYTPTHYQFGSPRSLTNYIKDLRYNRVKYKVVFLRATMSSLGLIKQIFSLNNWTWIISAFTDYLQSKSKSVYEGASFVGDQPAVAMALLTLAVGCNGFIYAGEQSAMLVSAVTMSAVTSDVRNNQYQYVNVYSVWWITVSPDDA